MVKLTKVKCPDLDSDIEPVILTDETINLRKQKVLRKMKEESLDTLVIWADLEHGSNFEYLVGFLPRFEEAILVLHNDGEAYLVLGNENLNKAPKARIPCKAIHMPCFSLPNQPDSIHKMPSEILSQCKFKEKSNIGIVGWKLFNFSEDEEIFDIPSFIIESLRKICIKSHLKNATYLFIGEHGVRITNNANELAHYEYGGALAGNCMLNALNQLKVGTTEMELASYLDAYGQPHNVVTIMAAGERFENANMYPSMKKIQLGDTISITTGFKGGLQSRAGYAVHNKDELSDSYRDYLEKVAIPYYQAIVTWLENIHIGMKGGELYDLIEEVLPKQQYGWNLNPGHLCADEEWLTSPIYINSNELIKSGMLFQIDIIPSVPGYGGISCESGIFLADRQLRSKIQKEYPKLYKRIQNRRIYLKEQLGINMSEEICPTSITTAYCTPFLLNNNLALKNE